MSKLEKGYSLTDQNKFSTLSGDFNPIHLEFEYARRSLWGEVVVHGVHQVLSIIDLFILRENISISLLDINVEFINPLPINTKSEVVFNEESNSISVISTNGFEYSKINFSYERKINNYKFDKNIKGGVYTRKFPEELIIDNVGKIEGDIDLLLNYELLQELFPNIINNFPYSQVAILLSSTQLVGMKCPGKNSIFSKLEISFDAYKNKEIDKVGYKVKKVHNFFKMVDILGYGYGFKYVIRSFFRPKSQSQISVKRLSCLVDRDQFTRSKVLIVGGSRGIGEVAAKILAIGGAEVTISYLNGEKDAAKIVDGLKANGYRAKSIKLDILEDNIKFLEKYTHLYYFASPRIFTGKKDVFSQELFSVFSSYYLDSFAKIVVQLYLDGVKRVFYPSSTAVDELINGMWEYSSVKAAGEHLCDLLEKRYTDLKIYKPRFPRISTDQTLTVAPVKSLTPESVLVEYIVKFHQI